MLFRDSPKNLIGEYREFSILRRGTFGTVSLYSTEEKKFYAIKEISIEGLKEKDIRQIYNEVSLYKKMDSYFIVKCYDSFIIDSYLYIVLQYLDENYETLRYYLRRIKFKQKSTLGEEFIWKLFLGICLGVATFHTNNIIHRNLKPENVFINNTNILHIGEPGILRNLSSNKSYEVNTPETLIYIAPEALVSRIFNEKTDIWSLGVILYELCTLELPFSNIYEITANNPKEIPNSYSQDLKNLINELLQKDPQKRPNLLQLFSKENIQNKLYDFGLLDKVKDMYSNSFRISEDNLSKPKKDIILGLQMYKSISTDYPLTDMCFLADGRIASNGFGSKRLGVHNEHTYQPEFSLSECYHVEKVCALRKGNVAAGDSHGSIMIYKINESEFKSRCICKLIGHKDAIVSIIELEDGNLCSCSRDGTMKIWDNNNKYQCIKTIKVYDKSICFSAIEINNYIVCVSFESVKIWDKYKNEFSKELKECHYYSTNAASKLTGDRIIIGERSEIFIIDVLSSQSKSFKEDFGGICYIFVLSEEKVLLGNSSGEIVCYNLLSCQIIFTQGLFNSQIDYITRTEDNKLLIVCSEIYIYDTI